MAKRLDDHPEVVAAEYEGEQPARELLGFPKLLVFAAAVGVSL